MNIPIEPIEDRYSVQWDKWFDAEFRSAGVHFVTVYGDSSSGKIHTGSFLDVLETNQYKASQLIKIIDVLKERGDDEPTILFFHDIWTPQLTNLAYIRDGLRLKNLWITGCLHAGSYDEHDFLHKVGMTKWAAAIERSWFSKIVDEIYVATEFHKRLVCIRRNVRQDKVKVTGFPLFPEFVSESIFQRQDDRRFIVFPHRLDEEKRPDLFDRLIDELELPEGWHYVKTKEQAFDKQAYYEILHQAFIALSFAEQETWGIAMQEAALCGAIPIVPSRLSYRELYHDAFRYEHFEEVAPKIMRLINKERSILQVLAVQRTDILRKGETAIPAIINYLSRIGDHKA